MSKIHFFNSFFQKREFIGSVFVTFGTLQDAENFFELRRELVFKDGRKLSIKWRKDYDENRIGEKKITCLKKIGPVNPKFSISREKKNT